MINIRGRLIGQDGPMVMGIINITEDSFYAASRVEPTHVDHIVRNMRDEGAMIIDVGACSTRPGSEAVSEEKELELLLRALEKIRSVDADVIISVDTFRTEAARRCIEAGADIINDVSGGADEGMFELVADAGVPYVLTHSRGNSKTMQSHTDYEDVAAEVLMELAFKADRLHQLGATDVIIDPGFGFAKTREQNYSLLANLGALKTIGCSILAGISRKSMICNELGCGPEEALNGTTAANMIALMNGADILRVHDVKEARETIKIFNAYRRNMPKRHSITTFDTNRGYDVKLF